MTLGIFLPEETIYIFLKLPAYAAKGNEEQITNIIVMRSAF